MLKKLFVLVLFGILIYSCGEKKNEPGNKVNEKEKYSFDSTDIKTEGVDNSGKPFFLEYKFKKGEKLSYRLTTISSNTQTIKMDTTISTAIVQKITYLFDINVKEVDEDGSAELEVKINNLKLEADANGQKYDFETGKDKDTAKIKQYAEFYALYSHPFSARFNKHGNLLEIYKADKISNKYIELKGADTISIEERNEVRQSLINGVLLPFITQVIRKTTDKEVYKDSTWKIDQAPVPLMVYKILYSNTYKIESVDKLAGNRIAVINADVNFTFSGQSKVDQGNLVYNFDKPKSTADGKIYFDVDKGVQIKSKTNTRMELSYTMEANTPQGKQKGRRTDVVTSNNILELL